MRRVIFLSILAVIVMGLSACSKSECEKFYDMLVECEGKGEAGDKAEFVKDCEKDKDKEDSKAILACTKHSKCDEFKGCLEKVFEQEAKKYMEERAKEDIKDIEAAITDAKWTETPTGCYLLEDDDTPAGIKEACAKFFEAAHVGLTTQLTEARDNSTKLEDRHTMCFRLSDAAEKTGKDKAAAETLCKEVDLAAVIPEIVAEVDTFIGEKKAEIPFNCTYNIDRLAELESEWAKGAAQELAKKCFLQLGQVVLDTHVPGMKYSCNFHVKKVFEAAKKFNLSGEAFDARIEEAKALCDKE